MTSRGSVAEEVVALNTEKHYLKAGELSLVSVGSTLVLALEDPTCDVAVFNGALQ